MNCCLLKYSTLKKPLSPMGINLDMNSNITVFKLVLDVYHQVLQYWPLLGASLFSFFLNCFA